MPEQRAFGQTVAVAAKRPPNGLNPSNWEQPVAGLVPVSYAAFLFEVAGEAALASAIAQVSAQNGEEQ